MASATATTAPTGRRRRRDRFRRYHGRAVAAATDGGWSVACDAGSAESLARRNIGSPSIRLPRMMGGFGYELGRAANRRTSLPTHVDFSAATAIRLTPGPKSW